MLIDVTDVDKVTETLLNEKIPDMLFDSGLVIPDLDEKIVQYLNVCLDHHLVEQDIAYLC